MARRETILDLIYNSLKQEEGNYTHQIGQGGSARVFHFTDPQFSRYAIRVNKGFLENYEEALKHPSSYLDLYNSKLIKSTHLTPINYGLGTRNFGQALVALESEKHEKKSEFTHGSDIQIVLKQPEISLHDLCEQECMRSCVKNPILKIHDGYATALEKVANLDDDAIYKFLEDTLVLNQKARFVGKNSGNIMYAEGHLGWVDVSLREGTGLALDDILSAITKTSYYTYETIEHYDQNKLLTDEKILAGQIEKRIKNAKKKIEERFLKAAQTIDFPLDKEALLQWKHDHKVVFKRVTKIDHLGTLKLSDSPAKLLEMLRATEAHAAVTFHR